MWPEAAPQEVLRPEVGRSTLRPQHAAAPLRASRRARLVAKRRQTRMLRKVKEAPERTYSYQVPIGVIGTNLNLKVNTKVP